VLEGLLLVAKLASSLCSPVSRARSLFAGFGDANRQKRRDSVSLRWRIGQAAALLAEVPSLMSRGIRLFFFFFSPLPTSSEQFIFFFFPQAGVFWKPKKSEGA